MDIRCSNFFGDFFRLIDIDSIDSVLPVPVMQSFSFALISALSLTSLRRLSMSKMMRILKIPTAFQLNKPFE